MSDNKRVGMITLHSLYNCGSMLQSYALNHFLNTMDGVDCEIIDFIPNSLDNKRAFRIEGELAEKYAVDIENRNKKFSDFMKQYYRLGATAYHSDEEIEKNPPIYDIYVSGSDQIWNANFRIASRAYFLGFTNSKYKYAFAPSVGRCMEERLSAYYDELQAYKKIWVREKVGAERIKNVTGRNDIGWMSDPTLLYTQNDYNNMIGEETIYRHDYIACYATLDEQLDMMMPILEALSKRFDLPVLLIGGVIPREEAWIINRVDIGPLEFLQVIRDAKLVLSQTFHGTIFSIIYNKNFLTFNDSMPNFRKTGLLREFGLLDRIVHNEKEIDDALKSPLDYEIINEKMQVLQAEAKGNIYDCIKGN
ncbi:MAG: polysaccharide pyruvyl transferase family protein [Bacteroides sp.]|nr:polysaccharide pyruvyl transferase family protein [Bacteroides sp.]MCM1549027.1 polysaccharide pyruvyl transferase family protein [Clostridium sp.]